MTFCTYFFNKSYKSLAEAVVESTRRGGE